MAIAGSIQAARLGSAAELAAYSGLSAVTIRRLVKSGQVRGCKVGRRLLIPYEDLNTRVLKIEAAAPAAPVPTAFASVDASGRAVALSPEEARRRAEGAIRALAALDDPAEEAEQRSTLAGLLEALGVPARARR